MLSAPVLVIPEVDPQPGSASLAAEGSAEEVPPEMPESTTQQHSVSTTRAPDPQATNSKPIPGVVPTVKRPRGEDEDANLQNKKKKRRKKSGQQSK